MWPCCVAGMISGATTDRPIFPRRLHPEEVRHPYPDHRSGSALETAASVERRAQNRDLRHRFITLDVNDL